MKGEIFSSNDKELEDYVSSNYELDLVAFYKLLEEDILQILEKSKGNSVEEIIAEINKLFV